MSTDILSVIDGAIDDWETSGDAMRWTPDPAYVSVDFDVDAMRARFGEFGAMYATGMREAFQALVEVCASTSTEVQQFAATLATEEETEQRSRPHPPQPQRRDDRPAYVSPHGPPPRRRR